MRLTNEQAHTLTRAWKLFAYWGRVRHEIPGAPYFPDLGQVRAFVAQFAPTASNHLWEGREGRALLSLRCTGLLDAPYEVHKNPSAQVRNGSRQIGLYYPDKEQRNPWTNWGYVK
jgi:hypothetical protein